MMQIGRQWEDRLRLWAEQFPKHYAVPVDMWRRSTSPPWIT